MTGRPEKDLARRLATQPHRRTQGCIGSLTNLRDRVCYLAIATGTETITGERIETVTIDNAAQTQSSTACTGPASRCGRSPTGTT